VLKAKAPQRYDTVLEDRNWVLVLGSLCPGPSVATLTSDASGGWGLQYLKPGFSQHSHQEVCADSAGICLVGTILAGTECGVLVPQHKSGCDYSSRALPSDADASFSLLPQST
jgi:hypothetical protein